MFTTLSDVNRDLKRNIQFHNKLTMENNPLKIKFHEND